VASGERIVLRPNMNIIFEVDSLENASPACISRCGVVYLDAKRIDMRVILNQYQRKQAALTPPYSFISEAHLQIVKENLMWLLPPCFLFLRTATTILPFKEQVFYVLTDHLLILFVNISGSHSELHSAL
jgi:dynein heavy chain, axonemal